MLIKRLKILRRLLRPCPRASWSYVQMSTGPSGIRVRFAPSPTGQLHVGGLRTALYNYLFARSQGGKFILRIEDTDQTRIVPGAAEKLIDVLKWAGIEIDEGPLQGGPFGPYVQSQRLSIYQDHIQSLVENGSAYHCFCTPRRLEMLRRESLQRGETPKYDNKCRHLSAEETAEKLAANTPHVVRLKLEHQEEPWEDLVYGPIQYDVASVEGDPVLLKTDGFPTYHYACVVDDHLMQISHVLRGSEWQVSTPKHLLIYKAFGWEPPKFGHLPLLLNKDGKKLSKRQGDVHVEAYRDAGHFPDALLSLLTSMGSGFRMEDPAKCKNMDERIQMFDLSRMRSNSSRVDFDRLALHNHFHLNLKLKDKVQRAEVIAEVRGMLQKHHNVSTNPEASAWDDADIHRALSWAKDHIKVLPDILTPYFHFIWMTPNLRLLTKLELHGKSLREILQDTHQILNEIPSEKFIPSEISQRLRAYSSPKKLKFNQYMKALRMSLSGNKEGSSVAEMMWVLGKNRTLKRIMTAISYSEQLLNGDKEESS